MSDDPAERQADALERLADEMAYQSAVLTEIAFSIQQMRAQRAVTAGLRNEVDTPSPRSLQTSIEDHAYTREEGGGDWS